MLLIVIPFIMSFVASRLCWRMSIVCRTGRWLFGFERQVWRRTGRRLWRRFRFECEAEFICIFLVWRTIVRLGIHVWLRIFVDLWPFWWTELSLFILCIPNVFMRSYRWCPYRVWARPWLVCAASLRARRPLQIIEMGASAPCWRCFIGV